MGKLTEKSCYKVVSSSGIVPKENLDRLYRESEASQASFSDLLIHSGLVKETDLLDLYAKSADSSVVDLKNYQMDSAAIAKVPAKFAWYYKCLPVKIQGKKITIAVSHILDVHTVDEIRFGLGFDLEMVFAPKSDIEEMLKRFYGLGADTVEKILAQAPSKANQPASEVLPMEEETEDIEKLAEKASIVDLVNQIILEAYKKRASDIHIEPFRGNVRLRYRIDGVLMEQRVPQEMNQFISPILSRIKIMANLNIVERRLPQDGKAHVKVQDQTLDLRVSSIPTPHGESLVIRILPTKMIFGLDQLGFEQDNLSALEEMIRKTHGIIFVTGPTGSGKSTTLYTVLNSLNKKETKIITIEDPIEYEIPSVTQIQVTPEIGLTFARGLRSILRHDPDIMMVGEVRDLETADTAIRVALTGHLIFSTVHTNDAASGVTRLLDIGVEPYLVASSVIGFIAQRLVRVICPNCKEENKEVLPEIREMIRRDLAVDSSSEIRVFRGRGCDDCNGTGFRGRTAVHEILRVTEDIRRLVFSHNSSEEIKRKACTEGMQTLRQDGWRKVLKGITTPEEVIEATAEDERSEREAPASPEPVSELPAMKSNDMPKEEIPENVKTFRALSDYISKKDFVEKRNFPRVSLHLSIPYRSVSLQDAGSEAAGGIKTRGKNVVGRVENISAGGIALLTYQSPKPGDLLELSIDLPDRKEPIQCIGRVLHIHRFLDSLGSEGRFNYRIGLSFLAIGSNDRWRIENYCKEHTINEESTI